MTLQTKINDVNPPPHDSVNMRFLIKFMNFFD